MSHSVLLDIETYAIDTVADFIEEPTAPANYKNPDTIAAYVTEARRKAITKAALKPDLGRIVAIAWMQEGRDFEPRVMLCKNEHEEKLALVTFWDDLAEGDHHKRTITYNGHRFDLPFVMRRSLALGVQFPRLRVDRGSPHLDLYRVLSFDDAIDGYSLQFYLKRYGLDAGVKDDMDGSDIARLVEAGAWDQIANHCVCDVKRLWALAEWLGAVDAPRTEVEQAF
jgi:DNA polymerase elongation subunit (family B)